MHFASHIAQDAVFETTLFWGRMPPDPLYTYLTACYHTQLPHHPFFFKSKMLPPLSRCLHEFLQTHPSTCMYMYSSSNACIIRPDVASILTCTPWLRTLLSVTAGTVNPTAMGRQENGGAWPLGAANSLSSGVRASNSYECQWGENRTSIMDTNMNGHLAKVINVHAHLSDT